MNKIQEKRSKKQDCIIPSIFSILVFTIIFIWYHNQEKEEPEIGYGQNIEQESMSNDSCSFLHIIGDEYCDDEANIAECGYDFEDCCDMDSDRTLCTDCFCYIPEEEIIMLDEDYEKNCQKSEVLHLGDGLCDLLKNDKENYFDVGDCCLENPICMSSLITLMCPENVCIKSNIFCITEELGDGICQDHNNGPFCQFDLGDCCLIPGNFTYLNLVNYKTHCNDNCKNLDIYFGSFW